MVGTWRIVTFCAVFHKWFSKIAKPGPGLILCGAHTEHYADAMQKGLVVHLENLIRIFLKLYRLALNVLHKSDHFRWSLLDRK